MNADWPEVRLEDVLELIVDYRGKTPPKSKTGIPVLTAASVKNGRVLKDKVSHISQETYDRVTTRGLPAKGDVLITTEAPVGQVAPMPHDRVYHITRRIMALRGDHEKVDSRFLLYVLLGDYCQSQLRSAYRGSTVSRVLKTDITRLKFKLPALSEQKIIGGFLSSIDEKIHINRRINQTLEQMAQAIFKSWFVDFEPVKAKIAALEAGGSEEDALLAAMQAMSGTSLYEVDISTAGAEQQLARLQAKQPKQYAELRATVELFPSAMQDSELGEIPEGWNVSPISELFELHRGFDLPQKSRKEGSFEVYAAGGLHGTHSQFKMEPPGIITGRSGVIGNVYLSLKKYWPLNTTLYVRQFRACGPYYAYHLLKSLDLKAFDSGSAVPSLNRNFVHSTDTIKPNSEVLAKFESIVGSFFQEIVGNIDQNESLGNTRDTLLPILLSGELSISEAESGLTGNEETANV